jgi:uncharacterized membrane protein
MASPTNKIYTCKCGHKAMMFESKLGHYMIRCSRCASLVAGGEMNDAEKAWEAMNESHSSELHE